MDCRRYQQAISEAAAGALAPEHRQALDEHLAACPACAAQLARRQAAIAAIDAALLDASAIEPSPHLLARVQRDLLEAASAPALHWPWPRLAVAAAVAALALLAIWAARPRSPLPRKPAPQSATASAIPPASASEAPPTPNSPLQVRTSARAIDYPHPALRRPPASRAQLEKSALDPHFLALVKVRPERDALNEFCRLLQSGAVDPQSLSAAIPGTAAKEKPIVPLEIEPLVFRPLAISGQPADEQVAPPSEDVEHHTSGSDPRR